MSHGSLGIPAIAVITAAISMMLSVVFVHQWYAHRKFMSGLDWWSLAPVTAFVGALMLGTQGFWPPILSMVLANLVCLASASLFYVGCKRFFGEPTPTWIWMLFTTMFVGLYWSAIIEPDFRWRLAVCASTQIVLQSAQLQLLYKHRRRTFASYFLRSSTIFALIMFAGRLATVGLESSETTLYAPSFAQNIYLASFGFWGISQTIGIVLVVQEVLRDRLEELALRDALTGLLSRGAIFNLGLTALNNHRKAAKPLSVLLMDLDHFKATNDTYGHIVGDAVLRDFAVRAEGCLRPGDMIGRYGGEEFLAVLPGTTSAAALVVAERIRHAQSNSDLPSVTVSVGVAASDDMPGSMEPYEAFERLIDNADRALYQAKNSGRNRVELANLKVPGRLPLERQVTLL